MSDTENHAAGSMTTLPLDIDAGRTSNDELRPEALRGLMELAYDELRELARALMNNQPDGHTLQPTALVHEAAIRLLGAKGFAEGRNRSYFFGAMCRAMRRVLIDHARARRATRRGGNQRPHSLELGSLDAAISTIEHTRGIDLVELDEALTRLEARNPRQAEVVTMRFFGGFQMQEISECLQVSLGTIANDWRIARAWLQAELNPRA